MKNNFFKYFLVLGSIISLIFIIILFSVIKDQQFIMPVSGAHKKDYDQKSFGQPRVGHSHKGVDIFAKKGTPVISATKGFVVFTGVLSLGGNVVLIFGPDFRMYYYAHLDKVEANQFSYINAGERIGTVGKTGNAKFTPPHLHFSIRNIFPWKGGSYIDPVPVINETYAKR